MPIRMEASKLYPWVPGQVMPSLVCSIAFAEPGYPVHTSTAV